MNQKITECSFEASGFMSDCLDKTSFKNFLCSTKKPKITIPFVYLGTNLQLK